MHILVVGLNPVGTMYASLMSEAGHHVEFISQLQPFADAVTIEMIDARYKASGEDVTRTMTRHVRTQRNYDVIIMNVPLKELRYNVYMLEQAQISGPILLFGNYCIDQKQIDDIFYNFEILIAYPAGAAHQKDETLYGVMRDFIWIEPVSESNRKFYDVIRTLFSSIDITFEHPSNILEWIWIHVSQHVVYVSTARYYEPTEPIEYAMVNALQNINALSDVLHGTDEAFQIAKGRGADLRHYRDLMSRYKLPVWANALHRTFIYRTNRVDRYAVIYRCCDPEMKHLMKIVHHEALCQCLDAPFINRNMMRIREPNLFTTTYLTYKQKNLNM